MERPGKEAVNRRWRKLEKDTKELLGGRATPGSGNHYIKGDVQAGDLLCECKFRWGHTPVRGYYFPLRLEWLEAITHYAHRKVPLLSMEWGDGRRAFLLPYSYYTELGGTHDDCPRSEFGTRTVKLYRDELKTPHGLNFTTIECDIWWWMCVGWDEMRDLLRKTHECR